eukprot:scaffold662947_cov46-Prasinocladus_malaysianus.AAC.1
MSGAHRAVVRVVVDVLPVHAQLAEPGEVVRLSLDAEGGQVGDDVPRVDVHHHQGAQRGAVHLGELAPHEVDDVQQ